MIHVAAIAAALIVALWGTAAALLLGLHWWYLDRYFRKRAQRAATR